MAVQKRGGLQKSGVSRDKDRDEVYFGGRTGELESTFQVDCH